MEKTGAVSFSEVSRISVSTGVTSSPQKSWHLWPIALSSHGSTLTSRSALRGRRQCRRGNPHYHQSVKSMREYLVLLGPAYCCPWSSHRSRGQSHRSAPVRAAPRTIPSELSLHQATTATFRATVRSDSCDERYNWVGLRVRAGAIASLEDSSGKQNQRS